MLSHSHLFYFAVYNLFGVKTVSKSANLWWRRRRSLCNLILHRQDIRILENRYFAVADRALLFVRRCKADCTLDKYRNKSNALTHMTHVTMGQRPHICGPNTNKADTDILLSNTGTNNGTIQVWKRSMPFWSQTYKQRWQRTTFDFDLRTRYYYHHG